jgi:uncharacterized protein (DUF4213/DUF364 family)
MAEIREKIIKTLQDWGTKERVKEVRLGLGYTAVQLESGRTGLAFTFRQDLSGGCSVFHGIRPLAGRNAGDLLPLLNSDEKIEAAVGLATVNALSNYQPCVAQEGDILKFLNLISEDTVGMVGYFAPLVPELKRRVRHLYIFEKREQPGEILPEEAAFGWLPKCQIALITSTTILNNTIDTLLKASASCREVVLLGTSTPLLREAFKDTPVTMLSGIEVIDPKGILQIVSEGGGTRDFKNLVRKLNLTVLKS